MMRAQLAAGEVEDRITGLSAERRLQDVDGRADSGGGILSLEEIDEGFAPGHHLLAQPIPGGVPFEPDGIRVHAGHAAPDLALGLAEGESGLQAGLLQLRDPSGREGSFPLNRHVFLQKGSGREAPCARCPALPAGPGRRSARRCRNRSTRCGGSLVPSAPSPSRICCFPLGQVMTSMRLSPLSNPRKRFSAGTQSVFVEGYCPGSMMRSSPMKSGATPYSIGLCTRIPFTSPAGLISMISVLSNATTADPASEETSMAASVPVFRRIPHRMPAVDPVLACRSNSTIFWLGSVFE